MSASFASFLCFSYKSGSEDLDRFIFLLYEIAQAPSYALLTALCQAQTQLAPFTEMLVQAYTIPSFACPSVHMKRPTRLLFVWLICRMMDDTFSHVDC